MDEPPRRRRRAQPPQEKRSLPMAPILLGVVIAGFAIGGGISLLSHRGGAVAPGPSRSAPAVTVTLAPSPPPQTALAAPSQSPSPEATESPSPRPAPRTTASPRPAPTAAPTGTPVPPPTSPPQSSPPQTPAPQSPSPQSPRPLAVVAPPAVATPRPTSPPATPKAAVAQTPAESADSEFARLSAGVVRTYLAALARGDDAAAQAVLDAPAGSREAALSEKEFAGPDMRITDVRAHGTGDSARVDVDVQTAKGAYFAQFFVKRSPAGAALIVNHDFIKP